MMASSGTRRWDWRPISLRLWFVLVVGIGVVIPAVAFDNLKIIPTRSDFITFYTAGSLARDGRAGDVYNPQAMDMAATAAAGEPVDGLRWLYPPAVLLVTWPFALLAPLPDYLLWPGLGVIAVAVMTLFWLAPFAMRYATGMAGFQVGPPLAALLLAYAVWYGKQGASSVEPAQPGARELSR